MLEISALETVHGPIYNINLVDNDYQTISETTYQLDTGIPTIGIQYKCTFFFNKNVLENIFNMY